MAEPGGNGRDNERLTKLEFAVMALASVLTGLAIYLAGDWLGISQDTARLVSTAFLVLGIADTLVLYFWERLFRRSG